MNNNSFDDMIDDNLTLDFFNQTDSSNSTLYQNKTKDFIFDIDWIPSPVDKTDIKYHDFEPKLRQHSDFSGLPCNVSSSTLKSLRGILKREA